MAPRPPATAWRRLWALARYLGCREGELLGLKWSDVDWRLGTVTIQRTLVRVQGRRPVFGDPKTTAGLRTLPLVAVRPGGPARAARPAGVRAAPAGRGLRRPRPGLRQPHRHARWGRGTSIRAFKALLARAGLRARPRPRPAPHGRHGPPRRRDGHRHHGPHPGPRQPAGDGHGLRPRPPAGHGRGDGAARGRLLAGRARQPRLISPAEDLGTPGAFGHAPWRGAQRQGRGGPRRAPTPPKPGDLTAAGFGYRFGYGPAVAPGDRARGAAVSGRRG